MSHGLILQAFMLAIVNTFPVVFDLQAIGVLRRRAGGALPAQQQTARQAL